MKSKKMIKIQFFFHEFFLNELLIIVLRVLISIFHIKIIKMFFFCLSIKQMIYLLTMEHCYKYCSFTTCDKFIVAKYHTYI